MTRPTTIFFGPPGTGKTTSVLDVVEAKLAAGADPARIAFFAFTRKAAGEAISRASARFNYGPDELPWFRTLHSAAFKLLNLSRDRVMGTENYRELGAALGSFTFKYNYDETTERPPQGGGLGDKALALYGLARARMESIEDCWRVHPDPALSLRDALRFAAALKDYKQSMNLLDFTDFLDPEKHMPLDVDTLIIDEAQDLTRQQWAFARAIGSAAGDIIIAGDDDQAVFQWAGADVRTFLSLRGDVKVLPVSYRLPSSIWNKSEEIARRIRTRKAKDWQPRPDADGRVAYLDYIDQAQFNAEGSWLALVRHQYQLPWLRKACRDQGIVYQEAGEWSNQAAPVRAVMHYERLRKGDPISLPQLNLIQRFVPGMPKQEFASDSISWGDIAWPFADESPDWMHALTGIGNDEREYIRRLKREGASLTEPGRVVLSTIHGSKGGEADNVMIVPDVSRRVSFGLAADAELRVWYVAYSRARQNLFLTSPQTSRHFT